MQFLSSTGLLYPQSPMLLFWFVLSRISRQNALVLHPFLTMLPKATPIFQASYLEAQSPEVTSAVQYSTQPAINGLIILRSYDFSIRNCFSAAGLTLLRQILCRRGYGPKHTYGITVCSEGAALAALVPLAVFFVVGFGWQLARVRIPCLDFADDTHSSS